MTAPRRQMALPSLPRVPSCSLRKYDPRTAPRSTDMAPNGVTRIAGAKAYAAKLKISPITTTARSACNSGGIATGRTRTRDDACPPDGALEVYEAIAFEAVSFFCVHEALRLALATACPDRKRCCRGSIGVVSVEKCTFFVMTKLTPAREAR